MASQIKRRKIMKLNKFIASAFIATLVGGTAQVMAADQLQTRDQLNLELSEGSAVVKDQSHDRDQLQDHDGVKAKKQHKYQYQYKKSENHSGDIGSSIGGSSNGGGNKGKVRRK